jgi:uncharacterized protein (TIGR00369 family)
MSEPIYDNCFACGKDNPIGLKLEFCYEEGIAKSVTKMKNEFQGYPQVVHGGIVATLLDEAMAKIILYKEMVAVTAEMNVKYRKPLPIDKEFTLTGEIILEKSRTIKTVGKIVINDIIVAEATATYVKVKK